MLPTPPRLAAFPLLNLRNKSEKSKSQEVESIVSQPLKFAEGGSLSCLDGMVGQSPIHVFHRTHLTACSTNLDREIPSRDTGIDLRDHSDCNSLWLKILPLSDCSP